MAGTNRLASFADFLAPVTVEQFRRAYLDRAPLHLRGTPETFADVMSWDGLNRLLDMTEIWTSQTLNLALDRKIIAAEDYCRRGRNRDGRTIQMPEPARVRHWLGRGASLLLNDIDALAPGLRTVSDLLERALGGRVQINLYCSWRERQAFPSHFDTHDVFALHIAGEKRWTIYQGRGDQPVDHPVWKALGQPHHERAKGEVLMVADLRPGDILYLPRGQDPDALATGEASIHLAVGVNEPIGLDVVSLLFEAGVREGPLFRTRLPPVGDGPAVERRLVALADDARAKLTDPGFRAKLQAVQADHLHKRGGFPAAPGFRDESVKRR
jgi:ribosomal protein L16 Arg81 hydroxylase